MMLAPPIIRTSLHPCYLLRLDPRSRHTGCCLSNKWNWFLFWCLSKLPSCFQKNKKKHPTHNLKETKENARCLATLFRYLFSFCLKPIFCDSNLPFREKKQIKVSSETLFDSNQGAELLFAQVSAAWLRWYKQNKKKALAFLPAVLHAFLFTYT